MTKLSRHRVLLTGILSPIAALVLYSVVYGVLTALSSHHEKDWLFRLSVATLAMTIPFFATLTFALSDRRRQTFALSGKIGLAVSLLSLAFVWSPVHDGVTRWKQSRNSAMRDVAAPLFDTPDLSGQQQRLHDQEGKVILVNVWATWCGPCRSEMPKLDGLYRARKDQGLMVFGLSDEDLAIQRKFLQETAVSYPLLTVQGTVPSFYRDIARYPALFLIDRAGRLQPAPSPDQPFERVESAVDALLKGGS